MSNSDAKINRILNNVEWFEGKRRISQTEAVQEIQTLIKEAVIEELMDLLDSAEEIQLPTKIKGEYEAYLNKQAILHRISELREKKQ